MKYLPLDVQITELSNQKSIDQYNFNFRRIFLMHDIFLQTMKQLRMPVHLGCYPICDMSKRSFHTCVFVWDGGLKPYQTCYRIPEDR